MRDNPTIKWSDLIEPDESLKELYDMLEKLQQQIKVFSASVTDSGKQMKNALGNMSAVNDSVSAIMNLTQQAQDVKKTVNAMQEMTKAMAQAKAASSNLTQEMLGGSSSVKTLTATLRDNMRAFEELTLKEKDNALAKKRGSAEARSYLDKVSSMRVQIEATTRALKAYTTEIKKETIGNMEVEKTVIKLAKKERELLQLSLQRAEASKKARKMEDLDAKIAATKEGSYERLNAEYRKGIMLLQQMSTEELRLARNNKFIESLKEKARSMRRFEEETGNFYLGEKGRLNKMWNGLDFSVAQIVREMPNMAFGARTFIMALSNNFGELFDQIQRFKMEQKDLAARGEATTSVWRRLGQSLFSLNTIVMAAVTVFTLFGESMWKAVKAWWQSNDTLSGLAKTMKDVTEKAKDSAKSFGDLYYSFQTLRKQWSDLSTDLEKAKWIDVNREAFDRLGVSILDAADADSVFMKSSQKMIQVLSLRAQAEAAVALGKEKSAEALKARIEAQDLYKSARSGDINTSDYLANSVKVLDFSPLEAYGKLTKPEQLQIQKAMGFDNGQALFDAAESDTDTEIRLARFVEWVLKSREVNKLDNKAAEFYEVQTKITEQIDKVLKGMGQPTDPLEISFRKAQAKGSMNKEGTEFKYNNADYYQHGLQGAKYTFKALKEEKEGSRGPEGMDFDAWYARVDEAYRHKRAEAEAKADKDDWERKIKLIDERYEHEKAKMKELRRQANDILSGKTNVKGGVTAERRDKLVEFIGRYDGLDQSLDDARMTEITDVINKRMVKQIEHEKAIVDIKLKGAEKGSQKERELQQQRLEFEKQLAVLRNELLPESERVNKEDIIAGFERQRKELNKTQKLNLFSGYTNDYLSGRATEKLQTQNQNKLFGFNNRQQELYDIQTQKDLLEYERERLQIELEYTDDLEKQVRLNKQIADLRDKYDELDLREKDRKGVKGLLGSIEGHGSVSGGILDMMGMDDKAIDAVGNATDKIVGYIGDIIDANAKLAESAVKTQETRVKAAQTALDAELEASKNGYANRVVSAQEELKLEKQKLKEQKREREKALKAQRAMDTAEAASSLTVALAQLWKSCINTSGPLGVPLAIALSAVMLGAFVTSRVKARQASQQDAEYGEGGIEFLDGGSHASGNDIDLHTKNKEGRNMRAEGGEALAIINKRNTRKYRKVLPDVIDSLNRGVFEEKYLKAFEGGAQLHAQIIAAPVYPQTDLSKLENKLDKLISLGENKVISLPNGNTIEYIGNVKRIVKKND